MTWGYKMVNPRRVLVLRDTKKRGPLALKYHRADKLHVVAIAAGMTHSTAVTEDGLVFYWISSDPHLRPHQVITLQSHLYSLLALISTNLTQNKAQRLSCGLISFKVSSRSGQTCFVQLCLGTMRRKVITLYQQHIATLL